MITKRIGRRKVVVPTNQNLLKKKLDICYTLKKKPSTWQNVQEQHMHFKITECPFIQA